MRTRVRFPPPPPLKSRKAIFTVAFLLFRLMMMESNPWVRFQCTWKCRCCGGHGWPRTARRLHQFFANCLIQGALLGRPGENFDAGTFHWYSARSLSIMLRLPSYLQKRSDTYYLRLEIPKVARPYWRGREFKRSLNTPDRAQMLLKIGVTSDVVVFVAPLLDLLAYPGSPQHPISSMHATGT